MITKNEAAMLPDMLSSVAGLWDELIVADTGSDDGTVALLTDHGATVVHHPWNNDFSAARNASLAPATGDWILFLDADERATPTLCQQIKTLMIDDEAGAATVVMRNELPGGEHREAQLLRLFRNHAKIQFRHKIHEDVLHDVEEFLARGNLKLRALSGVVHHLGYVREVAAAKDKRQRDQNLLRDVLKDDPRDFYCWFKLLESARYWQDITVWQEAATQVEPLLMGQLSEDEAKSLRKNPWSGELAALISVGLEHSPAEALEWLEKSEDRIFPSSAWYLQRGLWCEELGQQSEAGIAYLNCLDIALQTSSHHHVRARLALSRLAAAENNFVQAQDQAWQAVAMAPSDQEAILGIISFAKLAGDSQLVPEAVIRQVQKHPASTTIWATQLIASGELAVAMQVLAIMSQQQSELAMGRSEERRVGKECRSRWSPYH